jgi:hypothetical protein
MLALSIRQPHAELILRGIKLVEYRSRATTITGVRFYVYACKRLDPFMGLDFTPDDVETGVLVGTVAISHCDGGSWHLVKPRRLRHLLIPIRHPQPVWFRPF